MQNGTENVRAADFALEKLQKVNHFIRYAFDRKNSGTKFGSVWLKTSVLKANKVSSLTFFMTRGLFELSSKIGTELKNVLSFNA